MSALDWAQFFETVSLVDEALRAGPNYAAMDFATRDAYRHAVEELAAGFRPVRAGSRHARPWLARTARAGQTTTGGAILASISSATGAWPSS